MKIWIGVLLAAVLLTSVGCFEMPSVYPLYTDQSVVAEPRLVGAWQSKDGKDQIFIRLAGDREYRLTHINDEGEASRWELRLVKLGGVPVADMVSVTGDASIPAHHFLALSFDKTAMKIRHLDSKPLREKAAKEGLAYVRDKKGESVITAPTAAIVAFLGKNLPDEMKKDADMEFLPLK
jgi:hypothetical protein